MMTTGIDDILGSLSPASFLDRALAYSFDAARSILRLTMRRVERTADVVDSEYNTLHWQKVLADKAWLRASDLADYLTPADTTKRLRKVNNEILRISTQKYYQYRIRALSRLIEHHCGGAKQIVELGAGCGTNLFSLHLCHPDWTLKGFDVAPNGIAAGREIAAYYGLSNRISLDRIDLTDSSDPNLGAIRDEVVFTYFCIEQIPHNVRQVVENIIAAKPRRVINIEPTTELLDLKMPRDLVSLFYIHSVDYQTQLFSLLDELERQSRIRIVARERMPFAPTIHNDGFLYCWEPT